MSQAQSWEGSMIQSTLNFRALLGRDYIPSNFPKPLHLFFLRVIQPILISMLLSLDNVRPVQSDKVRRYVPTAFATDTSLQ
jgi:hypothetical protein